MQDRKWLDKFRELCKMNRNDAYRISREPLLKLTSCRWGLTCPWGPYHVTLYGAVLYTWQVSRALLPGSTDTFTVGAISGGGSKYNYITKDGAGTEANSKKSSTTNSTHVIIKCYTCTYMYMYLCWLFCVGLLHTK